MQRETDVVVVGAGIIGLSLARRLAREELTVTVLERSEHRATGGAASDAAGGMLAPSAELQFEELDFYRLQLESARRWPTFAAHLEEESGVSVDYRPDGTLMVAADRDDAEYYRRLYRFQKDQGLRVEWLSAEEALEVEPFLSPRIAGAILAPDDHQVDNRAVMEALREVARQDERIGIVHGAEVAAVEPDEDRPAAVTTDGRRFEARVVVLAPGAWARAVGGMPEPLAVRPIRGQMLALVMAPPFELRHVIRLPRGYVVPRSSGRLLVGATSEEMGFDCRVTGGGVYRLLEAAVEVLPGVEELELSETWAGLRPASRDHRPLIGFSEAPGVVVATGHFRHGILLAPITADELAGEIAGHLAGAREESAWLKPFRPDRGRQSRGTNTGVPDL